MGRKRGASENSTFPLSAWDASARAFGVRGSAICFLKEGGMPRKKAPCSGCCRPGLLAGERHHHHERLDSLGYFYEDETKSGLSFLGLKRR